MSCGHRELRATLRYETHARVVRFHFIDVDGYKTINRIVPYKALVRAKPLPIHRFSLIVAYILRVRSSEQKANMLFYRLWTTRTSAPSLSLPPSLWLGT